MTLNVPKTPEKLSFLKPSTALPGPSRVHSPHPGQGKGTELRQDWLECPSGHRSQALEEEAEMWLRQGEWSQGPHPHVALLPPPGAACLPRGLCTQGSSKLLGPPYCGGQQKLVLPLRLWCPTVFLPTLPRRTVLGRANTR